MEKRIIPDKLLKALRRLKLLCAFTIANTKNCKMHQLYLHIPNKCLQIPTIDSGFVTLSLMVEKFKYNVKGEKFIKLGATSLFILRLRRGCWLNRAKESSRFRVQVDLRL
jgi:hypothetical protein